MNLKTDQRRASPDVGRKNIIDQRPESNSSVSKHMLFINTGGIYLEEKKTANKILL